MERVLIPIWIGGEQPGAYGSIWTSHLTVQNDSDRPTLVLQSPVLGCVQGPCDRPNVQARTVFSPFIDLRGTERASYLFVERGRADDLHFQLRIQDLSRRSETWGTELPVVRERDARTGRINLLDVPTGPRFRQSLRVYDFDDDQARQVRLRVSPMPGPLERDPPALVDTTLTLHVTDRPYAPGYAEIGHLVAAYPQLAGFERVRIELEPVTAGLRFWGLISVTNNETQHVTTITPQ